MTRTGQLQGAFAIFLLLCLAVPTATRPAAAQVTATRPAAAPSTRREIQAIYNKIDAALARKDIDTASDYDADDCQFYDRKGHLREEGSGRQALEDLAEELDTIHETTKILSFTGTATEATVTVKSHATAGASNRINGRAIKAVFDEVSRDYWVKTDDGWRRKRSRLIQGHGALHKNF